VRSLFCLRVHICAAAVPSTVATEIPNARTVRFLILRGFHPASRRALSKSSAKSELSASNKLETIAAPPTFVAQIASAGGGTQTRRVRQRDHERVGRSRREDGRRSINLEHEPALRIYGRRTRIVQPLQSACAMPAPKGTNRPLESIAETQPQLQSALLRLSAMISQYLTGG
jgi:hypothetical protein